METPPPPPQEQRSGGRLAGWLKKGLKCLKALGQRDPRFRNLFNLSTPVLLSGDVFTQQLWDSLSQHKAPYGWRGLSHQGFKARRHSWETPCLYKHPLPGCPAPTDVSLSSTLCASREGAGVRPQAAIASTLSLLNGSESARLFTVPRELLPGCIRCAVVGNGGILNGSRQGQNIDAHDYVFRYVGQGPGRK
ncbi:ST6GALNAC2 [Cervus elaphus hippelaphus]|uniref:alpha-N-acetylgalactosaminide alpha-2,6-sialyltransferase n=1 Tax=Cervus elaphus hippelaphus TaxID=46360 RepID=A0A212D879_CEREH|nr:ST6GALNAC2 [Cervus elaphus hippelaphus]